MAAKREAKTKRGAVRPPGGKSPQGAAVLSGDSPRYRQILKTLLGRMEKGVYPVGAHLPTESELCAEFDVSRYTVRAALSYLVEHDMVVRRKGVGSVVLAARSQRAYQQSVSSLADLFQYAINTRVDIRSSRLVKLDAATAATLGAQEGEQWLRLDSVRTTPQEATPICCITSFLPERLAWIGPELATCVGPFYEHIEARTGETIARATQEIRGELMPEPIRQVFGESSDAVALCLIRHYFSAKGSVICSFNWHPAATFSYRMEIERKR